MGIVIPFPSPPPQAYNVAEAIRVKTSALGLSLEARIAGAERFSGDIVSSFLEPYASIERGENPHS
jgi:hypothetical protein